MRIVGRASVVLRPGIRARGFTDVSFLLFILLGLAVVFRKSRGNVIKFLSGVLTLGGTFIIIVSALQVNNGLNGVELDKLLEILKGLFEFYSTIVRV